MNHFPRVTAVVTSLVILSSIAFAADLKPFQVEAKEKFDTEIAAPLKATNDGCGTQITVKTNFEAYKEADWSNNSVSARCQAMIEAVGSMCERKAYKATVAKRIKEIHCLFGGKEGDTAANMSVTGSAFVFKMHVNHSNLSDHAKKALEDALNK